MSDNTDNVVRIGRTTIDDADHVKLRLFLDRVHELANEAGVLSYVIAAEWDVGHAGGTCIHTNGFMGSAVPPGTEEYEKELHGVAGALARGIDQALTNMVHGEATGVEG